MYHLRPPAVYAHESVVADARYKARMERVVAALDNTPPVTVYSDNDLPAMICDKGLFAGRVSMGTLKTIPDPILLFNTFRFDNRRQEREERIRAAFQGKSPGGHDLEALTGSGPFHWFTDTNQSKRICRPCWRIHFQNGCAHKCHYCGLGGLLATMVNAEDYIGHLDRLIALHPWEETYLLEDDADVMCLEPELGCLGPIIEYFGTLKDRYLIIHTKSANVDWMLDLAHNGKTIIVWSVSGPTQSTVFEPNTGNTQERIEAAHRAQEAGYVVRYKFKPIVPVVNWREEASQTIQMIFDRTKPDVISMAVFMWTDIEDMKRKMNMSLIAPEYVAAAEREREAMQAEQSKPFPHEVRAEIYAHHIREIRKHDPALPVSLSTESPVVWGMLRDLLPEGPQTYVCGCGPNATPGRRRLACNPFQITSGGPQGGFESL